MLNKNRGYAWPGYVNYFYKDGQLPAHTKDSFKEYEILTIHGVIVRNALVLMHKIKNFPNTIPNSIKSLLPNNIPTLESDHESSAAWLDTYGSPIFRSSIFYKGPILYLQESNINNIISPPSLFSLNIYKSNAKRELLKQQSMTGDDADSWPNFLLYSLKGLRTSTRTKNTTYSSKTT